MLDCLNIMGIYTQTCIFRGSEVIGELTDKQSWPCEAFVIS